MIPGETVQSMLPQDLPWWLSDHAVFFGVLYAVLAVIGAGVAVVILKSWAQSLKE